MPDRNADSGAAGAGGAFAGNRMRLPGYEQLEEIGRGGFAVVYRAWQPAFERYVAVKVLSTVLDDLALQRFERECLAVGALSGHPNIVTVYDLGRMADGRPYVVMEYLEAGSAADRLTREHRLGWEDVAEVGVKLAGALESAHQAKILHRDLKPENVLFSRFGEPKLADFGIARIQGQSETTSGVITATLAHAAPEVLSGQRPTVASDIYSLGSCLYMLLSGTAPFVRPEDDSSLPLLARVANDPVPDLRPLHVPHGMCSLIEQALAKAASDRYPTAADLGRRLQQVQADAGIPVTRLPLEGEPPPRPAGDDRSTVHVRREHMDVRRVDGGPPLAEEGRSRARRRVMVGSLVLPLVATAVFLRMATTGSEDESGNQPAAELGQLVLDERFSRPSSGWTQLDNEFASMTYADGGYRIAIKRPPFSQNSDSALEGPAFREDLTQLRNVSVEVDAAPEGDSNGLFGLICRQQGTGGPHYLGVVNRGGFWGLYKSESDPEPRALTRGETPLSPEDGPMRLRLECHSQDGPSTVKLRLFVNGRMVAEANDSQPLGPGLVGLTVRSRETPMQVQFDNLAVRLLRPDAE